MNDTKIQKIVEQTAAMLNLTESEKKHFEMFTNYIFNCGQIVGASDVISSLRENKKETI